MKADLLKDILNDMRVELSDEFDQNFMRGGFFGSRWKEKRNGEKSQLQGDGKLRHSIRATVRGAAVVFTSSEPYATIHNEGGVVNAKIPVTAKVRKFAWAKFYETGNKKYKAMALTKKTHLSVTATIPQRQFIGDHEQVRGAIEKIVRENVERHAAQAFEQLKQKK